VSFKEKKMFQKSKMLLSIITFEFLFGMFVGFFGFMTYDLVKCALWMNRIVIKIDRSINPPCTPSKLRLPREVDCAPHKEEKKSFNQEELDSDTEDEDLTAIIAKVRNQKKEENSPPSPPPNTFGQLFSELNKISTMSMDEFMKGVPNNNKQLVNDMFKIFDSATKGEKPDPEDMKKMTEEMADVLQQVFCGPMTEQEKAEERKDSDIILKRLKELHGPETGKEE